MKKIIVLLFLTIFIVGIKKSFSQDVNSGSDAAIFVLKLANGKETIARYPIVLLNKQVEKLVSIQRDSFFKQHPTLKGSSVFAFELKPMVTKIFSLTEIFNKFNIPQSARNYQIIVGQKTVASRDGIFAAENAIESVTVDEKQKKITVKMYADQ
ncbi:hypothetical protein ACJVDH_07515 [Pedobacter sp. AW1-32]|uniref:hypothetical protein n=1 Tax=Pedobacter sp. AW1-32 TaxID=3383026 RepID=UPI003FF0495A